MSRSLIAGIVEGFYGPPWTAAERLELFDWMSPWGLDTYLYAPKDDLHHRAMWRDPYVTPDAERLRALIRASGERGLRFVYGIGPGLDIQYASDSDQARLQARAEQMLALGCGDFALLFDDVPGALGEEDRKRWGALAPAQGHVANAFFAWIRHRNPAARVLVCPTAYCGRMAAAGLGGEGYLEALGRVLLPDIDLLWTGPDIVSREITVAHVQDLRRLVRRKPVVWDNLHANDYDGGRFFCGPYTGRPAELREEVNGLLSNPNCELPLNYVPIRTFARYVQTRAEWQPRSAWLEAMAEWHSRFEIVHGSISLEDLTAFGDCYYLPYDDGPSAQSLHDGLRELTSRPAAGEGAGMEAVRAAVRRVSGVCERLPTLRDRPLFHALSRRVWELREELDLLDRYLSAQRTATSHPVPVYSDFHQPGTYRGGFVARLQRLLEPCADGTFVPAAGARHAGRAAGDAAGPGAP